MSGRQLTAALVVIALLTFVLPPLLARHVNTSRVERAQEEAAGVADVVASAAEGRARASDEALVLAGPGSTTLKYADETRWPQPRATTTFALRPDPWGNPYLVVISKAPDTTVAVLSAGPNGVVETGFGATTSGGDDIVALKRRD